MVPLTSGHEEVHGGRPEGRSGVACPIPAALASKRIKDKTHILIYNIVLISAVQQHDSVKHIYIYTFSYSFHYVLSQDIEYSFLCYKVSE